MHDHDSSHHAGHDTGHNADGVAACCSPARGGAQPLQKQSVTLLSSKPTTHGAHDIEQSLISAQTFEMGDSFGDGRPADGEYPVHEVQLREFSIDATSVTNADFQRFVDATGYRTEAETFGFSAVFHLALQCDRSDIMGEAGGTPWWLGVSGADWAHPGGRLSHIDELGDHPVVHVSHTDALAYCAWAGRDLPTEAQWEAASRGGRARARYPWGDDLLDVNGSWRVNIWQGRFPSVNTLDDGFLTTAPVRTFEPNGYGLWQTVGNVWEWCADWWDPCYYAQSPPADPAGPDRGTARILRGGSFLCHDSYCNRYRNSARSSNTPDSSMSNAGFRTVSPR